VGTPLDSLTYLLQKVAKVALAGLEAELADLDLTARQYLLLTFAATGKELSQQDLAMKLGIDPTILVKLVDQLEDRGLLARARAADDRRRHQLVLTDEGKQLLREARARDQRVERQLTKPLGPRADDLRTLLRETLGH
jgi:DNA-binding MarR family transcriptional regulator